MTQHKLEQNCIKCGVFIGEPNKAYGYAGKWCHCIREQIPITTEPKKECKENLECCCPHHPKESSPSSGMEWERKFDELDIQVSPPQSLYDEELIEKLKYFCPIAWDLFKPDIKKFIFQAISEARSDERREVSNFIFLESVEVKYALQKIGMDLILLKPSGEYLIAYIENQEIAKGICKFLSLTKKK